MEIRDELKAFLDGELAPEAAAQVQAALDASPELREELEFMRALGAQIGRQARAVPSVEAPAGLLKPRRAWWSRPQVWAPAACAGLVLVAGLAVTRPWISRSMTESAPAAMQELSRMAPASEAPAEGLMPDMKAEAPPAGGIGSDQQIDRSAPMVLNDPNRRIIRTGSIGLEVEDLSASVSMIEGAAASYGGFVESSNSDLGSRSRSASLSLRVRSEHFSAAMGQIRQLGKVVTESSSGQDVTLQVSDLDARVSTLKAEEASLRELLRTARSTNDLLQVRDRLSQVRQEIESMASQRAALANMASLSTIQVTLVEKEQINQDEPNGAAEGAWTAALNSLKSLWEALLVFGIWVAVFSPVWLPIAAVVGFVLWRRRRPR
jgi:hypothetical protein